MGFMPAIFKYWAVDLDSLLNGDHKEAQAERWCRFGCWGIQRYRVVGHFGFCFKRIKMT